MPLVQRTLGLGVTKVQIIQDTPVQELQAELHARQTSLLRHHCFVFTLKQVYGSLCVSPGVPLENFPPLRAKSRCGTYGEI